MGIFIDDSAVERVDKLCKEYKEIYGKEVDFTVVPKRLTQEKLEKCVELMIKDNLSLIVAYEKIYGKFNKEKWKPERYNSSE